MEFVRSNFAGVDLDGDVKSVRGKSLNIIVFKETVVVFNQRVPEDTCREYLGINLYARIETNMERYN